MACLGCLWSAWCQFPLHSLNEARLAPAFALRHGINPYPPEGGGPITTWIYGPVGIAVNLPATLAGTAQSAIQLAGLINFSVLILPFVVIFFTSRDLNARSAPVRWFALALAVLLIPTPNLVFQVADHCAIGFGLLSCWCLARPGRPDVGAMASAAALCTLAIWSKQIAVFLAVAQSLYVLRAAGRAAMVTYLLWLAMAGVIALGVSVWVFGWNGLWLNMVVIPGRLPWTDGLLDRLALRCWPLFMQLALPAAGLALLWFAKAWPGRETERGRFFQLTALAAATMLPVGLAGFAKIGGDTNLLHSWDYLLPGVILAWLAADQAPTRTRWQLIAASAAAIMLHGPQLLSLPPGPFTRQFETASALTATYPHSIWFPRNPVITFYSDRTLWHTEDGVETRFLAGGKLREPDFRRYLPHPLEAMAYPREFGNPFSLSLLPELNQRTNLDYWTLYARPPTIAAKP